MLCFSAPPNQPYLTKRGPTPYVSGYRSAFKHLSLLDRRVGSNPGFVKRQPGFTTESQSGLVKRQSGLDAKSLRVLELKSELRPSFKSEEGLSFKSTLSSIAKLFELRSMGRGSESPPQKKSSQRSAGQASSPQNPDKNTVSIAYHLLSLALILTVTQPTTRPRGSSPTVNSSKSNKETKSHHKYVISLFTWGNPGC